MRKWIFISSLIVFFTLAILLQLGFFVGKELENANPDENTRKVVGVLTERAGETNTSSQDGLADATKPVGGGVLIVRVIDGDTVEIQGGKKVRYIGINTPETTHPTKGIECFGKKASEENRKLVEGKKVRLEKDVSEVDKYGRLLRYLWVGDRLINEILVKEGFAFSSPYPPDIKYQNRFNIAEKQAREANRGLWGQCGFIAGEKMTLPASDCVIKGNISRSGEKIYHVPGQRYYNQTVISENKRERWFCSEEEAQKAGWRRSKV